MGSPRINRKSRDRLDTIGEAIVKTICEVPNRAPKTPNVGFKSDRPGKTLVLDDRGIDSLTIPIHEGEEFFGLEFFHGKKRFIIPAESVDRLQEIVDELRSIFDLKSRVSWGTFWNCATEWVKDKHRGRTTEGLVERLLEVSVKSIKEYESCIPILHLSVEVPIRVGPVLIVPLDPEFFDRMDLQLSQIIYAETSDVERFVEKNRARFQGYSAAKIKSRADKEIANQIGSLAAQWTVDCLLFFSPAMLDPTKTPKVEVFNLNPGPGMCSFLFKDGKVVSSGETMVGPDRYAWEIPRNKCKRLEDEVKAIASLFFEVSEVPFRQEVLQAFRWYLKMPKTDLLYQKLVYAMMPVEALLHKDRSEKVAKMWPRFAVILANDQTEYDRIVKFGRGIYDVRSRLLHHGQDVEDVEKVEKFLKLVHRFMTKVLEASSRFETKDEFLKSIKEVAPNHHQPR
ncbi:MAG: hypothetical protein HDKAJFGB_03997 [Anaerolineae bacterium]|nr:hypothetical protein [Anaerolineae bacterium]